MKLKLEIKNCIANFESGEIEQLCQEAEMASDTLLNGTSSGGELTGWLHLASRQDQEELRMIQETARKIQLDSRVLVVIGIGGSYLGVRAALDFIKSPNYNILPKNTPDIYFIGNDFSTDAINEIIDIIGMRDFSVNIISKSGTTTEPAVAFRIFRKLLERKYGREGAAKRIYATTDKEKGLLKSIADREGYQTFVIPDDVGGRFSILSPVGLLPLAVAGIEIDKILSGAEAVFSVRESKNPNENPALLYAAIRNGLYRKGRLIEILAGFDPTVRFIGEWWKQLFGESEGKEHCGLFPAAVNYTTDLHSIGQYIQDGLRILIETFVKIENSKTFLSIPWDDENADGLNFLSGKSMTWANHQALAAASTAHTDGDVPNILVTIPDRSEESFGELIAFFELACGISGYMLRINPFNQPGVDAYKINMFALLGKPGYEKQREELEQRLK